MARRKNRRGPIRMLIKTIFTLAVLFVLAFAFLFGYLLVREHNIPAPKPSQAMIVLGAQVTSDGEPSKQLELRLMEALKAFKKQNMPIVVSGAQGVDEPATEASVMKAWLEKYDVPSQHILVEDKSFNTQQNIQNAIKLLPEGTKDVLIITSDYHLPRAMQIAKDLLLNPSGVGSPILPEYWIKNHARETMAWGKYYMNQFLPFIPTE